MALYSFGLSLALVLSFPWWLVQVLRGGRYREGLWERLGRVPARLHAQRGAVWVHAVSVGEVLAASRLIGDLEAAGHRVVISTTTQAGQRLARERFGAERVFYFPLDFAFAVRAWLRAVRPSLVVLMESEMWPRFLVECERAGVPVAVANARVSDRSFPRYMRLRFVWKRLLRKVRVVLAQSEEDARRWRAIGAPRVGPVGNLKYDVRSAGETELVRALRRALPEGVPVLVAGSTLEGEETALLDCWREAGRRAVMVLAPRHPQRFDGVERLLRERGVRFLRLSEWRGAGGVEGSRFERMTPLGSVGTAGFSAPPSQEASMAPVEMTVLREGMILFVDSIGELASLYQLATVAFVGGSVVDAGGHNPLEPAQWGVPVVMGPHYANFRAMVDAMRVAEAVRIVGPDGLCDALREGLMAPDVAMGERAREFFEAQAGATGRTMAALRDVLDECGAVADTAREVRR